MPGLYTRICASLVFPLHELLKGHATVAVHRELEETQWWPAEQLEALQLEKLRKLLSSASVEVPYYRDLLARLGIAPAQFATLRDLGKLPFLTKDLIRANTDRLKSDRAPPVKALQHGGIFRRAARFLHRRRPREPRCRREVARHPLVGCRHRRSGDRRLGLADRARRSGPVSCDPRPVAPHAAPVGLRDVPREARRVRRGDSGDASEDALRVSVGARAHRAARARKGCAHGRSRGPGRIRDGRTALRRSEGADRRNVRLSRRERLRRPGCRVHRA